MIKRTLSIILSLLILFCTTAHAELTVHFLDVGQGDAALIMCDGEAMMIDGGPTGASQYIYSYLRDHVTELEFIIATHPHEDHIGGLAAALNAVPVEIIFSPVVSWDSSSFNDMANYADLSGTPIIVPYEGDSFHLGDALVTILHCWPEAWDPNDMSIVLRIDYGETSFLFTGDAEDMSEYMMLDSGMPLAANVLKVGHHGSRTSSTREFIQEVGPSYAVISCGRGNTYGHPHMEVLQTLSGINILRTDELGTIVFHSDGTNITCETERTNAPLTNNEPETTPQVASSMDQNIEAEGEYYIGNKNNLKFHNPNCSGAKSMKEKNKVRLETREEAIEQGYEPCNLCQP